MADNIQDLDTRGIGFGHLSLRLHRESQSKEHAFMDENATPTHPDAARKQRFPENLHFTPGSFRMRSRTASTISSISSAHVTDSVTTYSPSTLASPISTSYASDIHDLLAAHTIEDVKHGSSFHAHKPSNATCSTFVNDEDDAPAITDYPDCPTVDVGKYIKVESGIATRSVSPMSEPIVKEEGEITPGAPGPGSHLSPAFEFPGPTCEVSSTGSEDFSAQDVDNVLDYTLQQVFGVDLEDTASTSALRQIVAKSIRDIGEHVWRAPSAVPPSQNMWGGSPTSTPSQGGGGGGGGSHGNGKRKKQTGGQDEDEDLTDGEELTIGGSKRPRPNPKEEGGLRLSCPFRKRNPHRFNVRDHYSCAMTYHSKFADVRNHITKQHERENSSTFACTRCNHNFGTHKELHDHNHQPKENMCEISHNDPEDGVDQATITKLVDRRRPRPESTEMEWTQLWSVIFPDDEEGQVPSYKYTPVIEDFELAERYFTSFNSLQLSLSDKIVNQGTLETIATKFRNCFVETIETCTVEAQNMPYTNRSNKRGGRLSTRPSSTQSLAVLHVKGMREVRSRPDSGVVVDDNSEESGSVLGLAHRSSVRTVRNGGRRKSVLSPEAARASTLPPPVVSSGFGGPFGPVEQFSPSELFQTPNAETVAMNQADVQAWSNSVMFNQQGDMFGTPEPPIPVGNLTPQPNFPPWSESLYQPDMATNMPTEFGDMGQFFTDFQEER